MKVSCDLSTEVSIVGVEIKRNRLCRAEAPLLNVRVHVRHTAAYHHTLRYTFFARVHFNYFGTQAKRPVTIEGRSVCLPNCLSVSAQQLEYCRALTAR